MKRTMFIIHLSTWAVQTHVRAVTRGKSPFSYTTHTYHQCLNVEVTLNPCAISNFYPRFHNQWVILHLLMFSFYTFLVFLMVTLVFGSQAVTPIKPKLGINSSKYRKGCFWPCSATGGGGGWESVRVVAVQSAVT